MTETEQVIDALESVERYLRNQDLSPIGMQVKGKVLEALERVNKNFVLADVRLSLPNEDTLIKEFDKGLSKSKEKHNFSSDELIAMRGGWVACGNWLRDKFK